MTTILPTDDLRPDLCVTVHSHLDRSRETARRRMAMALEAGEESPVPMVISDPVPDRTCYGVPLRIAAVNLPYVYCMVIEPGGSETGPSILDVRQVRFMRVNPETLATIRSIGRERVDADLDDDVEGVDRSVRSSLQDCP